MDIKIANMTQPTEKRTCLSKHLIVSCYKRIRERLWFQSCTWLSFSVLLIIPGSIGFWTFIEKPLEGGPIGAIMSIFIWTVVWIIGPKECIIFITGLFKAIASMKAGKHEDVLKDMNDTIQSLTIDLSYSDQSFDSKLPETLSPHGDNSISGNNAASANVENITKSAKKGDKEAQHHLGWMYAEGKGVQQDYEKAIEWFTKSAEQGNAVAQHNLGVMYFNGRGVPQDDKQAVHWYTKSAEQGIAWAQNELGVIYKNGEGVPQDYEKAIDWFTKSAEQGEAAAQNNLGVMYAEGKGVPQDDKQAVHWYTKSAEQGDARAQFSLGLMYYSGDGVPQDYKQAVHWYTKSAEQGYARAQIFLGVMYYNGDGVLQDYKKTTDLVTKSAEQGNARAQFFLGAMYYNGEGALQNYKKAYMWFNLASYNGHSDGQKARDTVAKKLSSQDLIEAQEMTKR